MQGDIMDTRAEKLNSIIADGKVRVPNVLQEIQEEWDRRKDVLAKPGAMHIRVHEDLGLHMEGDALSHEYNFTHHARNQLLARSKIPVAFADNLINIGETKLLERNLNILNNRLNSDGLLLRHINDRIKGVLQGF